MEVKPVLTRTEGCGIQIHIGSLIGNELRRQRRPAAWLAQEICCDRTNVYKILRKSSIDTELLCRISVELGHDFFSELQTACGFARNDEEERLDACMGHKTKRNKGIETGVGAKLLRK